MSPKMTPSPGALHERGEEPGVLTQHGIVPFRPYGSTPGLKCKNIRMRGWVGGSGFLRGAVKTNQAAGLSDVITDGRLRLRREGWKDKPAPFLLINISYSFFIIFKSQIAVAYRLIISPVSSALY